MSVYVDELRFWPMAMTDPAARATARRNGGQWCHMTADTVEELHAFAAGIGLKRAWFQNKPGHPHYDLTPGRREMAVKQGAIVKPAKQQARERRERRMDDKLLEQLTLQMIARLKPIVLQHGLPPVPESDEAVIRSLCGVLGAVYAKVHRMPTEAIDALATASYDGLQACRDHLADDN